MRPDTPFVLLDDARPGGNDARLYTAPVRVIAAYYPDEVTPALTALDAARAEGLHAAGYIAYEAGHALEPRLAGLGRNESDAPLLWFGLFEAVEQLAPDAVAARLPDPAGAWVGRPAPQIGRSDYDAAFARVREWIEAGDIYQANLTFRAAVPVIGDPLAVYAAIRSRAAAGYGGIVWTGSDWLLSFSPELFFALRKGALIARPMKGTTPRGATPEADEAARAALALDEKQRAENLMIVDLMRNDLTRIAAPGSVAVPELFKVETYPTLHTMVSTIAAKLAPDIGPGQALAAIFPCGSVTGAPKIRAMEVIAAVEPDARGAYTGSIGRIDPDGDAAFNVAIRTLHLRDAASEASIGLGSGVVADSRAGEEWDECLAKGAFLTRGQRRFDLIETMAFDPVGGIALLERHLARMRASAEAFGIAFDRHGVRNELQAATFRLRHPAKVRLLLSPEGRIAIGTAPMPQAPADPVTVALARRQVAPRDFRLAHKTSDRRPWPRVAGAWETLYVDDDGYLTEGSFTSLFVPRGDGVLQTPPLSRGILPGVLRAELIASGRAVEAELRPADLRHGFQLGNAVRGLVSAVTVAKEQPTDL
ncbi:para-aminobenzoate synthetase/4-amino-4-deoxychorismate lyase [Sphingomonas sp. BE123]|uniref:aminodeoxychorismate synthase component I n=1 Tax=Sphingomonas sp. BE123 TaxID=2817842 RepID=UPI0028594153|nr:aminodeoxychorismate synthase component I [Sphingomonas sp. BE123]MDR6852376.1 para-aminobenzoate synthetase/4-amino-4-deoxychorismate lyase [Sphingomonas sp. BE123]